MLLSDSVANAVYYYSLAGAANGATESGYTTSSGGYTPDSKSVEWVNGKLLAAGAPLTFAGFTTLPNSANALGISAQGGLNYITGSNPNQLDVLSTCNYTQVQTLSGNNPTLVEPIPNGTGAVAVDSPAVDVVSSPGTVNQGCPITTQSTITSVDMGVGNFNAQQLFFSSDSSRAWIISNLPELIYLNLQSSAPVVIPYAGGAIAYTGGITLDGSQVYVGTSDGTVHRIAVASSSDAQQIPVNLTNASGTLVAPNLVAVQP